MIVFLLWRYFCLIAIIFGFNNIVLYNKKICDLWVFFFYLNYKKVAFTKIPYAITQNIHTYTRHKTYIPCAHLIANEGYRQRIKINLSCSFGTEYFFCTLKKKNNRDNTNIKIIVQIFM